jgi:uncharacterized protein YbjT (DUF2867 family)
VVRGTTRDAGRTAELQAAGIEPWVGDPDRIGTLFAAFDQITVACVLLGSATGDAERIAALHSTRLEMLLSKLLDTTARGIVYEARGSIPTDVLEHGADLVRSACGHSRIAHSLIDADPGEPDRWVDAAVGAIGAVLASPPRG